MTSCLSCSLLAPPSPTGASFSRSQGRSHPMLSGLLMFQSVLSRKIALMTRTASRSHPGSMQATTGSSPTSRCIGMVMNVSSSQIPVDIPSSMETHISRTMGRVYYEVAVVCRCAGSHQEMNDKLKIGVLQRCEGFCMSLPVSVSCLCVCLSLCLCQSLLFLYDLELIHQRRQ
jgi:hypothetical protein